MDPPGAWSILLEDLLLLIFQRLVTTESFKCRLVCTSWKSAVNKVYPLLVTTLHEDGIHVLIPGTNQTLSISLPETRGTWFNCCPSSYGWLLTIHQEFPYQLHLLNPFTNARIKLPPTGTDFNQQEPVKFRVITSTSPSNPDCTFFLAAETGKLSFNGLALCKRGDERWTKVSWPISFTYIGFLFHKDLLYSVNPLGIIRRHSQQEVISDSFFKGKRIFLVGSRSGDLIAIQRWGQSFVTAGFMVYKYDESGQQKWSYVNDLGNEAIFFNNNNSVAVSATEYIRPNCIYFFDRFVEGVGHDPQPQVYNIKTRSVTDWFSWPSPIWFTGPTNWMMSEL